MKSLCEQLGHFVSPLCAEIPDDVLKEFELPYECKYSHIGTAIRVNINEKYFLLTANHCAKLLKDKLPTVFCKLTDHKDDELYGVIFPIKSCYQPQTDGYDEILDIAFYEVNLADNELSKHVKSLEKTFFEVKKGITGLLLLKLIAHPNAKLIIYGYPTKDTIDFDNFKINIREQAIPISNIKYKRNTPLLLEYNLEVPTDYDSTMLDGMSGGGIFCLIDKKAYFVGIHIQGSNKIGHGILTPLLCYDIKSDE